jgi:prephenate dehydrogenase
MPNDPMSDRKADIVVGDRKAVDTPFRRVAILGTGLIGGSFGLALRKHFPTVSVVGFDHDEPLKRAIARGAVQHGANKIEQALLGADLVYVALPIGATIEALHAIPRAIDSKALVTDACSTKAATCRTAAQTISSPALFLGGHPMAGKETSGIDNANAEIFASAPYALIGSESETDERVINFVKILRQIGARPLWCDAETHDWAVSIVSHLPQLAALALARVVADETDETGLPLSLAGKGLQDTLRLAGSPYGVWRDIFLTNRENITHALDRLAQAIDHLRTNLSSKLLEEEFRTANEVFELLHEDQEKPER